MYIYLFQNYSLNEDEVEDVGDIKKKIDRELAKFFFLCNIPFIAVEKSYFHNFIDIIFHYARNHPNFSYKPPCKETLASTLLRKIHEEITIGKKQLVQDTECVLQVDGWKNSETNKKLLVFGLTNFRTPLVYLTSYDISLDEETGMNLSTLIDEAIELAKDTYEANVVSIITDNDSKIKSGARLAANESSMLATCTSHSANRFIIDIITGFYSEFQEDLRKVVRAYGTSKVETLLLRMGGTKLEFFPDTRWCYLRNSCEKIIDNIGIMRTITDLENHGLEQGICDLVNSTDFENQVREVCRVLTPICILINSCQDPKKNIADATEFWLKLDVEDRFNELLTKRLKKALWPVGYAANYLHHKYEGKLLNADQLITMEEFLISHLDAQGLQELEHFSSNRESYKYLVKKCESPLTFWSRLDHIYKNLAKFAKSIFIIPASTARIEGFFSQWSYIHNSYRNRLGDRTSAQLIDVYSYFTLTEPKLRTKSKKRHISHVD